MSEIGELESPRGAMKWIPSCLASLLISCETEWRHFEWVFRNWFASLYDAAEERLDEAASAVVELCGDVQERRETDKALYMSLAMLCKNDALDVVKGSRASAASSVGADFGRSTVLRLGRRCTSARIFWSTTSKPRMASRRNW